MTTLLSPTISETSMYCCPGRKHQRLVKLQHKPFLLQLHQHGLGISAGYRPISLGMSQITLPKHTCFLSLLQVVNRHSDRATRDWPCCPIAMCLTDHHTEKVLNKTVDITGLLCVYTDQVGAVSSNQAPTGLCGGGRLLRNVGP